MSKRDRDGYCKDCDRLLDRCKHCDGRGHITCGKTCKHCDGTGYIECDCDDDDESLLLLLF